MIIDSIVYCDRCDRIIDGNEEYYENGRCGDCHICQQCHEDI